MLTSWVHQDELSFAMNRLLLGGLTPATRALLQVSPHHCWLLMVDAVVLDFDGGLLDAVSSAVYAALADTFLPKMLVQQGKDYLSLSQISATHPL